MPKVTNTTNIHFRTLWLIDISLLLTANFFQQIINSFFPQNRTRCIDLTIRWRGQQSQQTNKVVAIKQEIESICLQSRRRNKVESGGNDPQSPRHEVYSEYIKKRRQTFY